MIKTKSIDMISYISERTGRSYEVGLDGDGYNVYFIPSTPELVTHCNNYRDETKKNDGHLLINFCAYKKWTRHYRSEGKKIRENLSRRIAQP